MIMDPDAASLRTRDRARPSACPTRLRRAQIVQLYEVIDAPDSDEVFLCMEYVDGGVLSDALVDGPVDEATSRCVARDVAIGLRYLHAQGVVHRDIKPRICCSPWCAAEAPPSSTTQ